MSINKNKTELLAPAGTIQSFYSAINAGADAVYLGVNDLNARQRAKNFTIKTLSHLIPYAHSENVRVYVTLNTLVKQFELKQVVEVVDQLSQLRTDAVIVQDLGLASIINKYFKELPIHASTQMAIHNIDGIEACSKVGISRVVLARELTLKEIYKIKNRASVELELFIHGALCYSISGDCLASSYLGGASGNRGRCTQMCRRKFNLNNKSGFFFSDNDLQAVEYIDEFLKIGIASLKIEGRMKNEEYVHTVVSAYRKFIDRKIDIDETKELLKYDFGRKKTTLLLNSENSTGIINAAYPGGTGIKVGQIDKIDKNGIYVEPNNSIKSGDKLRIHSSSGEEGIVKKVIAIGQHDEWQKISLDNCDNIFVGDTVFIIGRDHKVQTKKKHSVEPYKFKIRKNKAIRIVSSYYNKKPKPTTNEKLFIKTNSLKWFSILKNIKHSGTILNLSLNDIESFLAQKIYTKKASSIFISLSPFIPQGDISRWKDICNRLFKVGITKFFCSNPGQHYILPEGAIFFADHSIHVINSAMEKYLLDNNFMGYTFSLEDDILNLKSIASPKGFCYIYANIPLFVSRVKPAVPYNSVISDSRKEKFITRKHNNLYYTLGYEPLSLTHRKSKLKSFGIDKFIVDLSFTVENIRTLDTIVNAFKFERKIHGTTLFNHKRGLK